MLMTVLAVAAPYLAATVTAAVAGVAADVAVNVAGGAAYDQCKSLIGKFRPVNHDLERAMVFANRIVARKYRGHPHEPGAKQIHSHLEKALNARLQSDQASEDESLVAAYMTGDPNLVGESVVRLCPKVDSGLARAYGTELFYAFSEALKEPQFERAQTAFLRDMLFAIRREKDPAATSDGLDQEIEAGLEKLKEVITNLTAEAQTTVADLRRLITEIDGLVERLREAAFGGVAGAIHIPAKSRNLDPKSTRRLQFAERLVPDLYGRQTSRQWLDEFLASDQPISWAVVYGPGGAGKSRLALDLLERTRGAWQGGFVKKVPQLPLFGPHSLGEWTAQEDTLFVVDYAQTKAEEVASAIELVAQREHPGKIRFLLLERYFGEKFLYASKLLEPPAVYDYRAIDSVGNDRYSHRLTSIDETSFFNAFQAAYYELTGKIVGVADRINLEKLFQSEEFRRRSYPLYAGLCAIHAMQNGLDDCADWQGKEIEEAVLNREARHWRNNGVQETDISAYVLATMMDGITPAQRENLLGLNWLPEDWTQATSISAGNQEEGDLLVEPMQPDPIGEHFVEMRLNGRLKLGQDGLPAKSLTKAAFLHLARTTKRGGQP